ncbi:MAG: hypothetical protein RJA35_1004, partial [Actinomycetota bacterium]|jgi:hypothetical protein
MAWHGVFTVLNGENAVWPASLSMAAGMGHIMLGLGLAFLMLVLGERVWKLAKRV